MPLRWPRCGGRIIAAPRHRRLIGSSVCLLRIPPLRLPIITAIFAMIALRARSLGALVVTLVCIFVTAAVIASRIAVPRPIERSSLCRSERYASGRQPRCVGKPLRIVRRPECQHDSAVGGKAQNVVGRTIHVQSRGAVRTEATRVGPGLADGPGRPRAAALRQVWIVRMAEAQKSRKRHSLRKILHRGVRLADLRDRIHAAEDLRGGTCARQPAPLRRCAGAHATCSCFGMKAGKMMPGESHRRIFGVRNIV